MENKYERKRRLERRAMKSPLYVAEKMKDYLAYIDPQLDKCKGSAPAEAARAEGYAIFRSMMEAANGAEEAGGWKAIAARLKSLMGFLRMAADAKGKGSLSCKAYGNAAKLLLEIGRLASIQLAA